jgi:hypothetical protein
MAPSSSLKGKIITQAIAVVVFVVVPIAITLMVPLTDLEFRRAGGGATVTIKRYVLMLIPWRTTEIENVSALRVEVAPEFRYRDTAENRRKGRAGTVSHATGQLVVIGEGREAIIQAAPEIAEGISAQFTQFLADKTAGPVAISVYASWSLSYLLGGTATAFAALYAIGACLAALVHLLKCLRRQH